MFKKMMAQWLDKGKWNEHKPRRKMRIDAAWHLARLFGARPCQNPVFVVGCGHSGTSLLLRILGEHSALHAIPYESRCGESRAPDTVYRKFDTLAWVNKCRRWIEKTPRNVLYLAPLIARFPEGRFIIIIRDGRDVISSLRKRGYTLDESIDRWVSDNRAAEPFWNHPQVFKFTYEELIAQPGETLTRILEFLGESHEASITHYHERPRENFSADYVKPATESEADHTQYRKWQINQPIFDGRGKWRKELSATDLELIEKRAGDMLRAYGYPFETLP